MQILQDKINSKKEASKIVGCLSSPEKMPGKAWSIPSSYCRRGKKLREIPGSVCYKCYASKHRYLFSNTILAMERRLKQLKDPRWVNAMSILLKDEEYFRWFDSGDLQNVAHLKKISKVCINTPSCSHWLSTREIHIVNKYLIKNKIPANLNIRISSDFINTLPKIIPTGCTISTCGEKQVIGVVNCPSTFTNNRTCKSNNCYACWDKNVKHVNYKLH